MGRKYILSAMTALPLALVVIPVQAQNATVQETQTLSVQDVVVIGPDTKLGTRAEEQKHGAQNSTDLRGDWRKYLSDNSLTQGLNTRPNAPPFIIFASSPIEIVSSPSSPAWLTERANAYQQAVLQAKENIANFIAGEAQSGRASALFNSAGQGIPSTGQNAAKNLSIMDKMLTLTDKTLDNEIKKYDAGWDGTGKTEAQRQERVVSMRRQYEENISASAKAFTSGAVPIYSAEGPTKNGYAVLVGLVVSDNMQKIARAISDPSVILPPDDPEPPIMQQIKTKVAQDPFFLTSTEGVRIMTDEKGQRSLVCFSGVPDTGDSMVTEKEAETSCRGRIAQFVAEQVVTNTRRTGGMAVDTLTATATAPTEKRVSFDQKLESQIKAETGRVPMTGLMQVDFFETKHHYSKQDMAIGVYVWNQDSAGAARRVKAVTESGAGGGGQAQTSPAVGSSGAPPAPVGRGMTTNPSKF